MYSRSGFVRKCFKKSCRYFFKKSTKDLFRNCSSDSIGKLTNLYKNFFGVHLENPARIPTEIFAFALQYTQWFRQEFILRIFSSIVLCISSENSPSRYSYKKFSRNTSTGCSTNTLGKSSINFSRNSIESFPIKFSWCYSKKFFRNFSCHSLKQSPRFLRIFLQIFVQVYFMSVLQVFYRRFLQKFLLGFLLELI